MPGAVRLSPWVRYGALPVLFVLPLAVSFGGQLHDIALYGRWAAAVGHGARPYVDVDMEYPPLALLTLLAPAALPFGQTHFAMAFVACMAAWDAVQRWVLSQSLQTGHARLWGLTTLAAILLNYTYLKRFDVAAALCTSIALVCLGRRPQSLGAWAALGLGAGIKLYPVVLTPVLLAYSRRAGVPWRRCGLQLGAALTAGLLPLALAYLWLGPQSLAWLGYHRARGLQLASSYVAAAIVALGGPGVPLPMAPGFGCLEVQAGWATTVARFSPGVSAAALAATYAALLRRTAVSVDLWRGAAAAIAALLLTAKVFSPQYAVWLVPLLAMHSARARQRGWVSAAALVMVAACTAQLFPGERRIALGYAWPQACLVARTATLLLLWSYLIGPGPPPAAAPPTPGSAVRD
jgi:hypothetical protein